MTSDGIFQDIGKQRYQKIKGLTWKPRGLRLIKVSRIVDLLLHQETRVLEVGFGTGLNFFLTFDLVFTIKRNVYLVHKLYPD
jgi:hypothetical protein